MKFELLIDANLELIETPIWDERIGKWYWTDLFSGDVHRYDPASKKDEVFKTHKLIGNAIPTSDVNKVLCVLEDGLYLLDTTNGALKFIIDPEQGNPNNRYNDSRVDAVGRVLMSSVSKKYGSPAYKSDMLGAFYMVDTDKSVKKIVDGINQYNAIVWNKSNTIMYVVDTFNQTLLSFNYDLTRGPISAPHVVLDFKDSYGMPDGMSIDENDNLYICHWTGKISVWDKNCKLKEVMDFPVEFACCTGFGGQDMTDLYVATSKFGYTPDQLAANKGAGGMFKASTDIKGRPDYFYKV